MTSRIVYVDDRCIELLQKHKTYQSAWLKAKKMKNPNQYIFIKRTTKANKTKEAELPCRECFHHFLSKFLKKNRLPHIDVHGLRRTAASYSISNQVPILFFIRSYNLERKRTWILQKLPCSIASRHGSTFLPTANNPA